MSVGRFLQQAAAGAGGDTGDDDFANVVLLLDGDGTSGDDNNTFTDSSTNGFTVTESGSVAQGSFSPYGDNWSNSFDGNSDYISIADSTDFDFGSGDWTVECWFNRTGGGSRVSQVVFNQSVIGASSNSALFLGAGNNGLSLYLSTSGTSWTNFIETSTAPSLNAWSHCVWQRRGNTLEIYLDGTLQTVVSGSSSFSGTIFNSSRNIEIGTQSSSGYLTGYLSNLRVLKGTAFYTSSFTPPTALLTAVTNTVLLACQSNRFIDTSSSSHTLTPAGTASVTPFSPFKDSNARTLTTDGGSGYFDLDSTAYLRFSGGPPIVSDMTISGWVHPKTMAPQAGNAYPRVFAAGNFLIYVRDDDIRIYNGGEKVQAPINNNEWTYFAAQRNSNTWTLYINGVSKGTASDSSNIALNPTNYIGSNGASNYFTGYIADLRITTSGSTSTAVPTSPVSAVTDTQLLLNFQDAGIYDRSGINNLDTVGQTQIDTAVVKYDTGSMQFDGTGDDLRINVTDPISFSGYAGDFTTEMWVYPTAVGQSSNSYVWQHASSSTAYSPFIIVQRPSTYEFAIYASSNGSSWNLISNATIGTATANTWHHIAVVRDGTNIKAYMNGTVGSTSAVSTTAFMTTSGQICIGSALGFSNSYFTGFIDDLRITKGVARYTANFTAPTDALPKF